MRRVLLRALFNLSFFLACRGAIAQEWQVTRKAVDFDRCELMPILSPTEKDLLARVRAAGLVAGYAKGSPWNPVAGWLEYDLQLPKPGWYEWIVPGELWFMEYFVDGELVFGMTTGGPVGKFWLDAGKHTLRLQRWNVGGFQPDLVEWTLRSTDGRPGRALRLVLPDARTVVRTGEEVRLLVLGSGPASAVTVRLVDGARNRVVVRKEVPIPGGDGAVSVPVRLLCPEEGVFELSLAVNESPLPGVRPFQIVAVDTRPATRGGELHRTLLAEIDCAGTEPAYTGDGGSKLMAGAGGKYRESGSIGYLHAQHHGQEGSWFAYPFSVPEAGRPYLLEADCPDDAFRTFAIAIREANPDTYPVAAGMDTGGCYWNSGVMQTQTLLFWPRSKDLRALFIPAHAGRPGAAVSRIRLYRVDGELPVLDVPAVGGRTFANWYEEGDNFQAMYGGDRSTPGLLLDADRWARSVASMGGNLLIDTVSVYQMSLYPSRYNRSHCFSGTFDAVGVLLGKCEKYGLGFVGEFHPECRDLDHLGDPAFTGRPRSNYLVNKDGGVKDKLDFFPKFHPLDPVDQEWTIGLLGEFADRYKDSPALRGVCLRVMGWQNPALNNFHSLDWGYDDLTVGLFEKETGLSTGTTAGDPGRFQARYRWLMTNAREPWISWRCRKISELYAKLRDRVRKARPDLLLYTDVFDRPDMGREAGIDPVLLGSIEGVVVVDSRSPYGRQAYTYEGPLADARRRDRLLDPALLTEMRKPSGEAAFMFYSCYFEGTEVVVPPERLGYPKETRRTWISAVVNPAGRQYLERYAVALAHSDVTFFADGGNAYTLGQPVLREFMEEYRRLPPIPFKSRSDARDPVVVRELPQKEDFLFYALNFERYPVRAKFRIEGKGPVRRLSTGSMIELQDGRLTLELAPYQLLALRAPAGTQIVRVECEIPSEARAEVEALVASAEALDREAAAGTIALDPEGRGLLHRAAAAAKEALQEGRFWRARTVLERSLLAERVYEKALAYPRGLEFLATPEISKRIRARRLAEPRDAGLALKLDRIEGAKASAAGAWNGFQAIFEGGCSLEEGRNGNKALLLDGKSGRVILKGKLPPSRSRSVSLWVNAGTLSGRRGLLAGAGVEIYFWNGSLSAEGGNRSGRSTCRTGDGLYATNRWYHIAVVFDSEKIIRLFVDGENVKDTPFPQTLEEAPDNLLLGWNGWGGVQNDPTPGWFEGRIADVRIFDRALSGEDVLALWAGR